MKLKKFAAIICCLALFALNFTSCGGNTAKSSEITFLNFDTASSGIYNDIAKSYEQETGVKVDVDNAIDDNFNVVLTAKMKIGEAPTIFELDGPQEYANWADWCEDLSNTDLYKHLTDKSLALEADGKVYALPAAVEGYGIIYNTEITDKYFNSDYNNSGISSMSEVNSYDKLKAVVEDMQKNKDALGIDGVFASTSLKNGEDWRWGKHLFNLPLYYEAKGNNTDLTKGISNLTFKYSENLKNIFDLYINNTTVEKSKLGSLSVNDSNTEFALGKCAMMQNGDWAYEDIRKISGNTVKAENIKFLPVYTGITGEENQGLCVGTERYYAINANASDEEKNNAKEFLYWLYSSSTGKDYISNKLSIIAPYDTLTEAEQKNDPLAKEVYAWLKKDDVTTIPWIFSIYPSETFANKVGTHLLSYAKGELTWENLKNNVISDWKSLTGK